MVDIATSDDRAQALGTPYVITRTKLGSNTKVLDEKFICNVERIKILHQSIGEKLRIFNPTKAGFQYWISFTDSTHFEHTDLSCIEKSIAQSEKRTEKILLNWKIAHTVDSEENELSITVRISNPVNPFAVLQAALSKDHNEIDRLELNSGSASVSVNGATQNTAEEIFAIVQRWAEACPKPQSITGINNTIYENSNKINFLNLWIFPLLFAICGYLILKSIPQGIATPYAFIAFASFIYIRAAFGRLNHKINEWASASRKFSMFLFTGGDENQQTEIAAKSANSAIKLFFSVVVSFLLNIAAGVFVVFMFSPSS